MILLLDWTVAHPIMLVGLTGILIVLLFTIGMLIETVFDGLIAMCNIWKDRR